MAKTLTTPITVVNNLGTITKWSVLDYFDRTSLTVPCVKVLVQAYHGATVYMSPVWLTAYDTQDCTCWVSNPASQTQADQLTTETRTLSNAYTTITTAHDNASGNNKNKLLAVEAALLSTGLVDVIFAGT